MHEGQRILIVEDDILTGTELYSVLSQYGYLVLGPLTSGEEVLEQIATLAPNFILMDINLAGKLDGIQTAQMLQKFINVPVVFLSALNDEETLQRAKLANPFGYLIKPYEPAELHSMIELTLHRFNQTGRNAPQVEIQDAIEVDQELQASAEGGLIADVLSKLAILKDVPTHIVDQLSSKATIRQHEAGDFLIHEGQEIEGVFIPLSGRVSVTKTADSGKELIVALLAPGDSFGVFYSLPSFAQSSSARTQIDSRVLWIPLSEWQAAVEKAPLINRNLADVLADRLSTAHALSSSLAHARVEERIINTLMALLPSFGKSHIKTGKEHRIFITRKELAELTGTTPETAIRVTKNLEREGLLDLTRPGIIKIPDVEALRKMLSGS